MARTYFMGSLWTRWRSRDERRAHFLVVPQYAFPPFVTRATCPSPLAPATLPLHAALSARLRVGCLAPLALARNAAPLVGLRSWQGIGIARQARPHGLRTKCTARRSACTAPSTPTCVLLLPPPMGAGRAAPPPPAPLLVVSCAFHEFAHMPGYVEDLGEGYGCVPEPPSRSSPRASRCFRASRSSIASASAIWRS